MNVDTTVSALTFTTATNLRVVATITSATSTTLKVVVPATAVDGPVIVAVSIPNNIWRTMPD